MAKQSKKSVAKKSVAKKSVAKKSVAKKSTAKKPVRQVPGRQTAPGTQTPIQLVHGVTFTNGAMPLPQTTYRVPTGQRLTIEYVAVSGTVLGDQRLQGCVGTVVNRVIGYYQFPTAAYPITPAFTTEAMGNQPVRIYADGGTDVTFWAYCKGDFVSQTNATVLLSGYLTDA